MYVCMYVCDECECAHVSENLKKFSKSQNCEVTELKNCRPENLSQILPDNVKVKVNNKAKAKNRNE